MKMTIEALLCLSFRAFKSILRCQRMKQYQPSTAFTRTSGGNNHFRARRSISCDFHGTSFKRRSDSSIHRRTSNENSQRSIPTRTKPHIDYPRYSIAPKPSISKPTIVRSLSVPDDTSPWHLRKPIHVR